MTNRKFNRTIYRHLRDEGFGSMPQHHTGYGWCLLAFAIVVCFILLSNMGIAS